MIPELSPGPVFEPTYVYRMLQLLEDTATFKVCWDVVHDEPLAILPVYLTVEFRYFEIQLFPCL
jgi:hypothetical protein